MGKKLDKDAGPGEKLLRLFSLLLFSQERYSLSSLAELLQCSKQTVLRLVDQMEATGWAKIQQDKIGGKAIYWIERPGELPKIALNPEGLAQLALCRNFLAHLLPPAMRHCTDATLQLAASYTTSKDASIINATSKIGRALTKGEIDYACVGEFLQTILKAASSQTICEVSYQASLSQNPRTFLFAPVQLSPYRDALYLIGWEVTANAEVLPVYPEPTMLLAHRLQSVKMTNSVWTTLPKINESGMFGVMRQEPFVVSIRVEGAKAVTYVAERRWSNDQQTILHEDGSLTLTMTAQSGPEIIAWVLSLKSAAEILSPDWLREEARQEVALLSEKYNAG